MSPLLETAQRAFAAWETDLTAAPLLAALELLAMTSKDARELRAAKALADDAALTAWMARDWIGASVYQRFEDLSAWCRQAARRAGRRRGWLTRVFGRRKAVAVDESQ